MSHAQSEMKTKMENRDQLDYKSPGILNPIANFSLIYIEPKRNIRANANFLGLIQEFRFRMIGICL